MGYDDTAASCSAIGNFRAATSRDIQRPLLSMRTVKRKKKKEKGTKKEGDREARERSARRVDSNEISIRTRLTSRR